MPTTDTATTEPEASARMAKPLDMSDLKAASAWPTVREIVAEYGVPENWVRSHIERRHVRAVRLATLRVDPEDWERFLLDRQTHMQ